MDDQERARIERRLTRSGSVELDWGVVLSAPSQSGSRGANGSYRWTYYDPPLRADGTRGKRIFRTARALDHHAWTRIEADIRSLEAVMTAQATGTRLDATVAELAHHWLEPARHPDWSEDYAKKVRSVTMNWLLPERITVQSTASTRGPVPFADVRLGELTPAVAMEALSHVRKERAFGTYRTAHECLTGILGWAVTIKWLPVGHVDVADIKRGPDPRVAARRAGARGNIAPVPKDDIPDLEERLLPFHRWVGEVQGHDERVLLDLLAFSGPRIGEALAAHVDRFSRDDEGNGWLSIEERASRHSKGQQPPKHRKHREVWVPAWLADDLAQVTPNKDGYLFGAKEGSTWPVARWNRRRFDRWAERYGWEELSDYCSHRGHDGAACSGQNRRRWRYSPHDWRHAAAVWQLFELRLDPEDVAAHLGHADGYTLYQLYVGARPGRSSRAAAAAHLAGDPRA